MDITFVSAEKVREDARLILRWRNDPETLKNFYHQTPKQPEQFWSEYLERYFVDDQFAPVFACHGEVRVAFLRFGRYDQTNLEGLVVDIDINVDPEQRTKGLGSEVLRLASNEILQRVDAVVAEIKRFNVASIRAFEKAGFNRLDEQLKLIADIGEEVPIYRYVKYKHDAK